VVRKPVSGRDFSISHRPANQGVAVRSKDALELSFGGRSDTDEVLGRLDLNRVKVAKQIEGTRRASLGQFLTPSNVARLMASMLTEEGRDDVELLDPGAGIGTLFTAGVGALCQGMNPPKRIVITAYEIEPLFFDYLEEAVSLCRSICGARGVEFHANLRNEDFVASAISILNHDLFSPPLPNYTHTILNPPYHKIRSGSDVREMLGTRGIETSNMYTAFLWLASMLLGEGGQMVSITPRSFCNGPYFKPFRRQFFAAMNIERLHLFQSRREAFQEDLVLQESLIMGSRKGGVPQPKAVVSSSFGPDDEITERAVERSEIVAPGDDEVVIHVPTDELDTQIAKLAERFGTLESLGIGVSTGRVVDFRAGDFIVPEYRAGAIPLIYPAHFDKGYVRWPVSGGKKPNFILQTSENEELFVPSESYVLVKRFSSKEERRRVVAAVYDPRPIEAHSVGFENHLNYFHKNNRGIDIAVAKGLAAFLNSTFVDTVFRRFSGHTQVNAEDLRRLRYPDLKELEKIGNSIGPVFPSQDEVDHLLQKELFSMSSSEPQESLIQVKTKLKEALSILKSLGLPREQQNDRSALTLLALLDLKPSAKWQDASAPLIGITPMMEFFAKYYEKTYAPNTRETVRRQTVHQFLDAGLIVENPDDESRPTNSPKAVYQIEAKALSLLRTYGTAAWQTDLRTYLSSVRTLKERYDFEREMKRIPVKINDGPLIYLSPGGQNVLIEKIITEFGERFTPGGRVVYVGDTGDKFAYFDEELLKTLGVAIEAHGKMPDVIIYRTDRNWLVLVEAVTSHGPVNPKRRGELKHLFAKSSAGLVFVTAFLTRRAMVGYLSDISWETEVWVADAPSHIIHFNGERFLGPYDS